MCHVRRSRPRVLGLTVPSDSCTRDASAEMGDVGGVCGGVWGGGGEGLRVGGAGPMVEEVMLCSVRLAFARLGFALPRPPPVARTFVVLQVSRPEQLAKVLGEL
jgi:hypothetical protein